ncbi:lysophospholipase [Actinomyces bowdenii]|uniref:alpha/beta hydrolase n=1 Tax=Actinomyces bowdenii TaxID=131109 RepID=UPI001ABCFE44|nr:alpha/beta hydrolase [Actinomyces bowdenii]MBO3725382.1 lysophospholipase [Actinomyces bowdenii]
MHTQITHMTAVDGTRLAIHSWLPDGVAPLEGLERHGAPAPGAAGAAGPAQGADDADPGDAVQQAGPRAARPQGSPAPPRAVIQVVHGMAEHAARYGRFAAAAVEAGYAVHADDHRGHGLTTADQARGHLAERDGWELVVADLSMLLDRIRATYPGVPVILMGHSWGSFLARDLAARRGQELTGLILLGAGSGAGTLTAPGMALASAESRMRGGSRPSRLLHALAFGPYRRHFAPNRTEVDWLSRDPAEVDRYVADPLCGFVTTSGFFLDLLAGMAAISTREHARSMPPGLPMLLASGDRDPVGAMGAGVRRVATMYRHAGVREVALTLYPGARHELLNETNRGQVTADLLAWIAARL